MLIGLAGSHRTGKTTLARRFAEVSGYSFTETSTSAIFTRLGMDPRADYSIEKRLWIQLRILDELERVYSRNRNFSIVDRTPIDMAAYMLADVSRRELDPYTDREIMAYVERCIETTGRYFQAVVIIQPGIPIVEDFSKAPAIESYMEHLNTICLGLVTSGSLRPTLAFSMAKHSLDLEERCEALISIVADLPMPPNVISFEQKLPM